MKKVIIEPGICGFTASVEAVSEDGMMVSFKIKSGCEGIMKMAADFLEETDAYEICLKKCGDGLLYDSARKHCPHAACPVPAGIIKCIEAECSLAIPKDASIKFCQD